MNLIPTKALRPILIALLFLIVACQPEQHPRGWQPLDLLPHGAPTTILAPPEAEVKKGQMASALVNDLSVIGEKDYSVQIFYGTAYTNDIARLKNDHLENVKRSRYFHSVVKEDAAGFIYRAMIDSLPSYGFRLVKLQGDTEFNFQNGMNRIFTLEDVEMMYEAVK